MKISPRVFIISRHQFLSVLTKFMITKFGDRSKILSFTLKLRNRYKESRFREREHTEIGERSVSCVLIYYHQCH